MKWKVRLHQILVYFNRIGDRAVIVPVPVLLMPFVVQIGSAFAELKLRAGVAFARNDRPMLLSAWPINWHHAGEDKNHANLRFEIA